MTKAYDNFYKANYTRAYRWVLSQLRDKDEAYDLVAEIFITVFEKFSTIENPDFYLNSAISNSLKNHYAKLAGKRKHTSLDQLDEFDPNVFVIDSEESGNPRTHKKAVEVFNKIMLESDELTRDIFKARIMGKVTAGEVQRIYHINPQQYNKILDATRKKILDLLRSYEQ